MKARAGIQNRERSDSGLDAFLGQERARGLVPVLFRSGEACVAGKADGEPSAGMRAVAPMLRN